MRLTEVQTRADLDAVDHAGDLIALSVPVTVYDLMAFRLEVQAVFDQQAKQAEAEQRRRGDMTELEQFKAMLNRAEIVYEEKPPRIPDESNHPIVRDPNTPSSMRWVDGPGTLIEIGTDGPNQKGYMCFVSHSIFNDEGKLVEWGGCLGMNVLRFFPQDLASCYCGAPIIAITNDAVVDMEATDQTRERYVAGDQYHRCSMGHKTRVHKMDIDPYVVWEPR